MENLNLNKYIEMKGKKIAIKLKNGNALSGIVVFNNESIIMLWNINDEYTNVHRSDIEMMEEG